MHDLGARLGSLVIGLATALLILAVTIPLFLNPWWVSFEQGRAQAAAWTGYDASDLRVATDSILSDLVFGPPDFDVAVAGAPVLDERERSHMRDVRGVFAGFFGLTLIVAVAAVVIAIRRRASAAGRRASWQAVRTGSVALIGALIFGGIISLVAFDQLFETFHQVFFPGGSYTFDPATDKLVQLFPFAFWDETALVLGAVSIIVAIAVAFVAHWGVRRNTPSLVTARVPAPGDVEPRPVP